MKVKTLSEMAEQDWVLYNWTEVTRIEDLKRQFLRGRERAPDEAFQAKMEWQVWMEEKQKSNKNNKEVT